MTGKIRLAFLTVVLLVSLLLAACAKPAPTPSAAEPIELIIASYEPATNTNSLPMKYFGDLVTERTGGRVKCKYYWDGTLASAKELLPLVSSGGADVAIISVGYYPAEFQLLIVTGVVMLSQHMDSTQKAVAQLFDEYPELLAELDRLNLKPLMTYPVDVTVLGSNKRIESVADMKGLRVRTYGLITPLLDAWGCIPVAIPSPDIYESVQRGLLDGYCALPMVDLKSKATMEVTKYCIDAGIGVYYSALVPMNKDTFASLPPDVQKIVEEAAVEANAMAVEFFMDAAREAIPDILAAGVEIYRLAPEVKQQLQELALPAVEEAWLDKVKEAGMTEEKARQMLARYKELCTEYDAQPRTKPGSAFEIYEAEFR